MFKLKAPVAAIAIAVSGGAQAALTNPGANLILDTTDGANGGSDVVVLIKNDADESLLVDTNLNARDIYDGVLTSYVSDAALTASIGSFLSGSTNAKFYAAGAVKPSFFDLRSLGTTGRNLTPNQNTSLLNAVNIFASNANFFEYGNDAAGDGADIENTTGVANLDYDNPDLRPFMDTSPGSLDTPLTFFGQAKSLTDFTTTELGVWNLSSNGELSFSAGVSAVPVPAAVWLFGSGLLGLVGIARRRSV